MNGNQLVRATQYLLEKEQSRLLREEKKVGLSAGRQSEIGDELRDVEDMLDTAREGWQDL